MELSGAYRRIFAALPLSHALVLAALVIAQVACGAWASVASSDTSRDIFFAQQIASAQGFPLTGPAINGMLHLGPLWYYLLAVPMLLLPDAATVSGAMGLLSATQFPLAYLLGRRVGTAREGLLFALCLAMPGWIITSFGSLTHPIIAIPSVLLGTFAVLAYRVRPDALRALGVALALVLMYTAHPTLVLLGAVMCAWAALRTPTLKSALWHACIVAVVVVVPFLPMLYEQWLLGFEDFRTTAAYTGSEWSSPSLLRAAELIHAVVIYGPQYATRFWLGLSGGAATALFAVYVAVLLLAAIGLVAASIADAAQRRKIVAVFALLMLQSVFLCAIRLLMPPWMIYIEWLLAAALIALGLTWFMRFALWRAVIGLLLATTTLWTFAIYLEVMEGSTTFINIQPSAGKAGFMDVRHYEEAMQSGRFARVPYRELFALGELLCEPVTLYGHYALQVDYTYAVGAAQACGTTRYVEFGGTPQPARAAWLGLHRDAWHALGRTPQHWIGALGIHPPGAVWHSRVPLTPVVPRLSNFPRTLPAVEGSFLVEGVAAADRVILVSHRAHRYLPFEVVRATANGREVTARYSDLSTALFVAPPMPAHETVQWRIEVKGQRDYVDVLAFSAEADGR